MTVAQLRSTSSSISSLTVSLGSLTSSSSVEAVDAFWASRRAFSPLINRGPKSGKLRDGSKGSHLFVSCGSGGMNNLVEDDERRDERRRRDQRWRDTEWDIPEIMEVVRIGTTEESIESELLSSGSIKLVITEEYRKSDMSAIIPYCAKVDLLGEIWERRSITLIPLHIQPSRIKQRIRYPKQKFFKIGILQVSRYSHWMEI